MTIKELFLKQMGDDVLALQKSWKESIDELEEKILIVEGLTDEEVEESFKKNTPYIRGSYEVVAASNPATIVKEDSLPAEDVKN